MGTLAFTQTPKLCRGRIPVAFLELDSVTPHRSTSEKWPKNKGVLSETLYLASASTVSSSSSVSMSAKPRSPNTWPSVDGRHPRAGGRSCAIMLTASRRWTCSWFRPGHARSLVSCGASSFCDRAARRRALSLAFLPRVSHRTTTSRDILRPWLCRSSSTLPRGDEAPSFVSRCRHAYVAGSNSGTINEKRQTPLARL